MSVYISILRGVNVSGQNKIRMADLKILYEKLGFKNVETYIQSGNVVFSSKEQDGRKISETISRAIHDRYGFEIPVLLRSVRELEKVVSGNPLLKSDRREPDKLHVTFLLEKPAMSAIKRIDPPIRGDEELLITGREVFLYCPHGYGTTKLNNAFFEKHLGVTATTRNWKTVNTLLEKAQVVSLNP